MNGDELINILEEFDVGVGPATKSQWRKKTSLSRTIVRNALRIFERQKFNAAISPIAEFAELHIDHGHNSDTFANRLKNKEIVDRLKSCIGIYAFLIRPGA